MIRYFGLVVSCSILSATLSLQAADTQPVDLANPLVGTASLDDPKLLGNAPPPGEEAYTGFVSPGPGLPHHRVLLNPINKDPDSANVNHGITCSYIHSRPTMVG